MAPRSPAAPVRCLSGLLLALAACGGGPEALPTARLQVQGRPELIEVQPGAGLACGGLLAVSCPEGLACEDDPSDVCEPGGGADCAGVCVLQPLREPVPVDCNALESRRSYVERNPLVCTALLYLCPQDQRHFFDECGCGCAP
ncbi:hypothetical protein [Archangium primigenium]|uniref:hypothetical protein n=1 Tax=[Archangium] primigenium TaxID=2792470 RepID=UPI00195719B5|nr:hypothetical protein [Archangium primigenium]MBM7114537.1 hypothetical protein [Archangium primigenium]